MAKFNDLLAHLAVALDAPIGEFSELLRVLRLTAADADDGRAFEWADNARLSALFRGKYGPGGGVEANPATLSFYLTALLVEGPRRTAAKEAVDIQFALTPLTPRGKRTERMLCAKTGQHYFGAALAKTLSQRSLFEDLVRITVASKLGVATLEFKDKGKDVVTMFGSERGRQFKPGLHSSICLSFDRLHGLFDLIDQPETTAA
jgi:hypothetical protein